MRRSTILAGVTAATRDTVAREIAEKTGAAVIPPFDDERIIAGAGTVGLEIVEEWPEVASIVVPLGGGGLLAGTALAATSLKAWSHWPPTAQPCSNPNSSARCS